MITYAEGNLEPKEMQMLNKQTTNSNTIKYYTQYLRLRLNVRGMSFYFVHLQSFHACVRGKWSYIGIYARPYPQDSTHTALVSCTHTVATKSYLFGAKGPANSQYRRTHFG